MKKILSKTLLTDAYLIIAARWLVVIGVILRFYVHRYEIDSTLAPLFYVLVLSLVIFTSFVTYWETHSPSHNSRTVIPQIFFDIIIFSGLYILTLEAESDFFLFYFLPIIMAAAFLSFRQAMFVFLVVCFALSMTLLAITLSTREDIAQNFVRIFFPRVVFYLLTNLIVLVRHTVIRSEADQLRAMEQLASSILSTTDMEQVLKLIVDEVVKLLDATRAEIYLKSRGESMLVLRASCDLTSKTETVNTKHPYNIGFLGDVYRSKQAKYVSNFPCTEQDFPSMMGNRVSVASIPLVTKGENILGVLVVFTRPKRYQYQAYYESALARFAVQSALAIDHVQTVNRELTLQRISTTLTSKLDLQTVYTTILNELRHIVSFDKASLQEKRGDTLHIVESIGFENPEEVNSIVFQISDNFPNYDVITKRTLVAYPNVQDQFNHFSSQSTEYHSGDIHSWLGIPLIIQSEVIGMIALDRIEINPFTPDVFNELKTAADYAALAMKNAQLYKTEHTLWEVSNTIVSASEYDQIASTILKQIAKIIEYDSATLQEIDDDNRILLAKENIADNQIVPDLLRPISKDPLIKIIVDEKRLLILADPSQHPDWETAKSPNVRSWIGIPLVYRDKVIGLITLDHHKRNFYIGETGSVLLPFIQQAAILVQNARLYSRSSSRAEALESLFAIGLKLLDTETLSSFLKAAVETAMDFTKTQAGGVFLTHKSANGYELTDQFQVPDGFQHPVLNISSKKSLTYQALVSQNIQTIINVNSKDHPSLAHDGVKAIVVVPLLDEGNPIGVLYLLNKEVHHFSNITPFLQALGTQIALASQKMSLIKELNVKVETLTVLRRRLETARGLATIGLVYGEYLHLSANTLGAARQYAINIQNYPEEYENNQRWGNQIERILEDLLELVETLHELSKSPEPVLFNVSDLIDDILTKTKHSNLIDVKWVKRMNSATVYGFQEQVGRLFRVVIYNAFEAMDGEGILNISLRDIMFNNMSAVQVSITDSGKGIPKDIQEYVFALGGPKRVLGKRSFGFGLAWAYFFLEWYGGRISFETETGKGTTFHIVLPYDFTKALRFSGL